MAETRNITVNVTVTDDDNDNVVLTEVMIPVVVPLDEEPEPEPPVEAAWRVTITKDEVAYEVHSEAAEEMGTYRSSYGSIAQQSYRYYLEELDLFIYFRPEEDGSRQEIIFERARCFGGTDIVHDVGPYLASIWEDDVLHEQIEIKNHYAFCRWRWQSRGRPVFASIKTLMDQGLLPPYERDAERPPVAQLIPYEPMGLAGVYPQMPDAGERPDIGPMTDPQAEYIVTGSTSSLNVLLAQAEASGSIPWHMRDENTGAPIDFEVYPKACWYYGGAGFPQVIVPSGNPVKVDSSHQPALNYVPFLLTGDPYYLEGLQFQATWNYGAKSLGYRPTLQETRQFAWEIRTLGQVACVTPMDTPEWLQPMDYWERMLDNYRHFFTMQYMESTSRVQTVFRATDNISGKGADHTFPAGTWCQPWQSEFLATMFAWLVAMGHKDWRDQFNWVIRGAIDRTSGQDVEGWPRALCTPYQMMLCREKGAEIASDYDEAWQINHDIAGLTYKDEDVWENSDDLTYLSYTRGALAYACMFGIAEAQGGFAWADQQFANAGKLPAFKWSF